MYFGTAKLFESKYEHTYSHTSNKGKTVSNPPSLQHAATLAHDQIEAVCRSPRLPDDARSRLYESSVMRN